LNTLLLPEEVGVVILVLVGLVGIERQLDLLSLLEPQLP
jgi:hypothetical protein